MRSILQVNAVSLIMSAWTVEITITVFLANRPVDNEPRSTSRLKPSKSFRLSQPEPTPNMDARPVALSMLFQNQGQMMFMAVCSITNALGPWLQKHLTERN